MSANGIEIEKPFFAYMLDDQSEFIQVTCKHQLGGIFRTNRGMTATLRHPQKIRQQFFPHAYESHLWPHPHNLMGSEPVKVLSKIQEQKF